VLPVVCGEVMLCGSKGMAGNLLFDDLAVALEKIEKYRFQRVVLQIPDELLSECIEIYNYFYENIQNENIDFYITADSTFGSSVDDISAEHVNSDLLIYFGTDLSGSCSIPMMIIPQRLPSIEIEKMTEMILQYILENNSDLEPSVRTLLIIDPSYHHQMNQIFQSLHSHYPNLVLGKKPPTSELTTWTPESSKQLVDPSYENLGGLLFALDDLTDAPLIFYIGNKKEQLISILLRMSSSTVFSYTPQQSSNSDNPQISHHVGVNRREYRERYAGVLRVKEASIIGLIIGAMSLTGELTQIIVQQLTELIETSGRKCYCFVMGRINEAKLCNFPEVTTPNCLPGLTTFLRLMSSACSQMMTMQEFLPSMFTHILSPFLLFYFSHDISF
jgi:diphthamide biosynthesis enzyme Dph1/Dph2-like protein